MGRVLAIGDIHTKRWIIDLVEPVINNYDQVVFCGDYADDFGQPPLATMDTWYRMQNLCKAYPNVKLVLGNHDYIYVNKTGSTQSGYNNLTQLLINAEEHQPLKRWLQSLPITLEIDGVTFSHAGIDERWDGKKAVTSLWDDVSPIWTRPDWAQYKNIPQVFGHTPQRTVTEVAKNAWAIDTFSTYPDGTLFGDGTMLEIIDGKYFRKIKISENSNYPTSFEGGVS